MAKESKVVEFANLIIRFGDKVLLDHFAEVIWPAVLAPYERHYADTKYFFEKVNLVHMGEDEDGMPILVLVGRFIKDGVLHREQIYVDGQLQHKPGKMQSSPSALFMLILHNHRLVYLRETSDAPSKETFRATLLQFIKRKHGEVLRAKLKAVDARIPTRPERKLEKEKLSEEYMTPTVNLIALSSTETVREFVARYAVLRQVKIIFTETNDESPMHDFFAQFKRVKESVGSDVSALTHNAKGGLDKDDAAEQIAEATEQGINQVQLSGLDEAGATLLGNNEEFKLKKTIQDVSEKPVEAASTLLGVFNDMLADGMIKVEKTSKTTVAKIKGLVDELWK